MDERIDRYKGLIDAIEFFSGRFDVEQIVEFAYEFVTKLLPHEQVALWVKKDHVYTPTIMSNKSFDVSFDYMSSYDEIVYFHAGLIDKDQIAIYFPTEISSLDGDIVIPMIMDKSLYGLIMIKLKEGESYNSDDEIIATSLMNLFMTALTNYNAFMDIQTIKTQLDEKVFNLFAINQSTKALLGEKDLNQLYEMAVGVFSELTQSCCTAFFLFDTVSETFELKSTRHVYDHSKNDTNFRLFVSKNYDQELPVLIDIHSKKDIEIFTNYFDNGTDLVKLIKPRYIVVLKKGHEVVGLVTLGDKINEKPYDQGIFELIESLASSTFIAISNAFYIGHIQDQTDLIDLKLQELIRLNSLMKGINGANSTEEIYALVLRTLNIHFGVEMAFMAEYKNNQLELKDAIGIRGTNQVIELSEPLQPLLDGEDITIYQSSEVEKVLESSLKNDFIESPSGLVMVPIYIEDLLEDDEKQLIGVIGILAVHKGIISAEDNMVKYEAISTHLAPVIYQLNAMEQIKSTYIEDPLKKMFKGLEKQMEEADSFMLPLSVILMNRLDYNPFEPPLEWQDIKDQYSYAYLLNNGQICVLTNKESDLENIKLFYDIDYKIECHIYKKQFVDLASYKKIF